MSILSDWQITARCNGGMVTPFDPALVNPASLDVRLGDTLLIESAGSPELVPYPLAGHTEENPYLLRPGQFVLAQTDETFHLPDDIAAQFMLKSSRARSGLEHLMAGYCDFDALQRRLDKPGRYCPRVAKVLSTPAPWDDDCDKTSTPEDR